MLEFLLSLIIVCVCDQFQCCQVTKDVERLSESYLKTNNRFIKTAIGYYLHLLAYCVVSVRLRHVRE
jgi:hypothetical protein